jgi:stringent starvation protein B
MTMTTSRPYLVRAIHEWILDNNLTPHLLVDIDGEGVRIPAQQGQNGKIVLNISPAAVEGLNLGNGAISFRARFGGVSTDVYVPVESILAIYAKENGRGMVFNEEDNGSSPVNPDKKGGKRPSLKIVK